MYVLGSPLFSCVTRHFLTDFFCIYRVFKVVFNILPVLFRTFYFCHVSDPPLLPVGADGVRGSDELRGLRDNHVAR